MFCKVRNNISLWFNTSELIQKINKNLSLQIKVLCLFNGVIKFLRIIKIN